MNNLLIQLTEADKRVLTAVLILVILAFAIIGFIGSVIKRVMIAQGKLIDTKVADVLTTRVITNKKHFTSYARKKNWVMFFKETYIPVIILLLATLLLILRNIFGEGGFSYNVFDYKKTGFGTLLFIWDFKDPGSYTEVFGVKMLAKWPPLINSPHFEFKDAWASYLFVPAVTIGGIWYLISVQALIARGLRIRKLKNSVFEKNLDKFNQNDLLNDPNFKI